MQVGDLVSFHSHSWVFKQAEKDYKNPGIVIEKDETHRQVRYTVMWSDGKITNEHAGYLLNEDKG